MSTCSVYDCFLVDGDDLPVVVDGRDLTVAQINIGSCGNEGDFILNHTFVSKPFSSNDERDEACADVIAKTESLCNKIIAKGIIDLSLWSVYEG